MYNMYNDFFSSNGVVTLPYDNCEVYFTSPILTFIPQQYIFDNYDSMLNYFKINPTMKVQNQVFKIFNYSYNMAFMKWDGYNFVNVTNEINSKRKELRYIQIFAQTTDINLYFNSNRDSRLLINSNDNEGLEGLRIAYIYLNNIAGTTFELRGMLE